MWLSVVIGLFAVLEAANVATLYFAPGSRKGNGVGVFAAWERSKADPQVHDLLRYLVWWVAGTKLIFLALLGVIFVTAPPSTQVAAALALAASIATFFWRLFPLARRMDREGQVTPRGYSTVLGVMIATMVVVIALAALVARG